MSSPKLLFERHATVTLLIVAICVSRVAAQTEDNALPFAGTDVVTILEDNGRRQALAGQIEQIEGETLTFRRSGQGNIQFIRISDITELTFSRSREWEAGLVKSSSGELKAAAQLFDKALKDESRDWAWIELQATVVKLLFRLGERLWAVERLEEILKRDPDSRHVSLVPLVWDERLPESERIFSKASELRSQSPLRRIVAASSLLDDKTYQEAARSTLIAVRRESKLGRLTELAEGQLWRLAILDYSKKTVYLSAWQDRVRSFDSSYRHGPQFVLARCQQQKHLHDQAAVGFLWAGLMSPVDPALAAQSLGQAVISLDAAGQANEAARIRYELRKRYPTLSAARE